MLRACRGEPVDRPPVWLMRQAGRYLPEYRALRAGVGFLDMCRDVERAVEVSLQPIRLVGSEAVVFFCDIFVPVLGMGVALDFAPGAGARRARSVRARRWTRSRSRDPRETVPYVFEILRRLRRELAAARDPADRLRRRALHARDLSRARGRATPTRRYPNLRRLMRDEPGLVEALLERLAEMTVAYLNAQIEAGAQVVQLFDTWAGALDAAEYERWLLPRTKAIAAGLDAGRRAADPLRNDAPHLFDLTLEVGADVLSIGCRAWRSASAARRAGRRASLQGNLDPAELARGRGAHLRAGAEIAAAARRRAG